MASTYLTRTPSSNGNLDKWTLSVWVKRCNLGLGSSAQYIASAGTASLQNTIYFDNNDRLIIEYYNASVGNYYKKSNRVFRDTSGWMHIVAVWDTGNSTAEDRMRLYVNSERLTSWQSSADPGQDLDGFWNSTSYANNIGQLSGGTSRFDGLMSHLHFIDGTVYEPSTFGETDSTTGEWKIKTDVSVTYGTNGFFILKDGNSVTDQSGNSNNLTASGTLTNTEDCPSDVFSTLNPLYQQTTGEGVVLSYGNTKGYYASDASRSCFGTIAPSSGKYYYECKIPAGTGTVVVGIVNLAWSGINGAAGAYHDNALNFGYNVSGQKTSGGTNTAYGSAIADNDILGCAMDLDNGKLYFSLNGSWQGSGDPTSGSTGTGSAFDLASGANYAAACRLRNGTICEFNFGNGYFGTTQISSEGTNASGIGKFEYDVPTGYTALSTKGLNE